MNRAAVRFQLTADQAQQCGFTGAARPHDGGDFAARDIDIDAVENPALAALKLQIAHFDQVVARRLVAELCIAGPCHELSL